jgi:hypothetical protein
MSSKLAQSSPSSIEQRRPLTKLALDNKIRAMLSQFHPRERNPIRREYLKSKLSSLMINDRIKIHEFSLMNKQTDEYISIDKKVTQWLEYLNDDSETKEINTI